MSDVPENLRYTKSDEWVRVEGNVGTVGLTDHAQEQLTDVVYVELPEVDSSVERGKELAVVESVKTAADIYSPVSGKVMEVNEALADSPELVNQEPYGGGWIARIELSDPEELEALLTPEGYKKKISE